MIVQNKTRQVFVFGAQCIQRVGDTVLKSTGISQHILQNCRKKNGWLVLYNKTTLYAMNITILYICNVYCNEKSRVALPDYKTKLHAHPTGRIKLGIRLKQKYRSQGERTIQASCTHRMT